MIAMRIQNWSVDQIAAHFDLTRKTVDETMDWAEKEGIIAEFEEQLIKDLVPLAIGAYKKVLSDKDNPNMQAARDVLMGAGILKKQSERPSAPAEPMDEVQIWMMKRQRKLEGSNAAGIGPGGGTTQIGGEQARISGQIAQSHDVLDADVIPPAEGPQTFALNVEDYLSQCDESSEDEEGLETE